MSASPAVRPSAIASTVAAWSKMRTNAPRAARVRELRSRGLSLERVAGILNAEGCKLRGGRFHVTTLARALARASSPVAA